MQQLLNTLAWLLTYTAVSLLVTFVLLALVVIIARLVGA
jgi:hypothetical protein